MEAKIAMTDLSSYKDNLENYLTSVSILKALQNEVNPKMDTLQKSQKTGIVNGSCFLVSLNCKRQSILLPIECNVPKM